MRDPMMEIRKLFQPPLGENNDGYLTGNFDSLRRIEDPNMPIPGLKRFCDSSREKIIIKTTYGYSFTRMWFKGNGDIRFTEIKEVKPEIVIQELKPEQNENKLKEPLKAKGLSQEERQRRRDRMNAYWKKKKGVKNAA